MNAPVHITFRHMAPSDALTALVKEKAEKLEEFYRHILGCRVVIEEPHLHHRKGKHFRVHVAVDVPGEELVADRDPAEAFRSNAYLAVSEAFRAMRRQVQNYVRRTRREVKPHVPAPRGWVNRIFPDEGYGFITTPDGRELYFHRNSLVDGSFEKLEVGDVVRFAEDRGDEGPRASTVHFVHARHPHTA